MLEFQYIERGLLATLETARKLVELTFAKTRGTVTKGIEKRGV